MRSAKEHIEQADRYADVLLTSLKDAVGSKGLIGWAEIDIRAFEMYLHAAEVELKLAEAKQLPLPSSGSSVEDVRRRWLAMYPGMTEDELP